MTEKNQQDDIKTQGKLKFLVSQLARMFGMKTQELSHDEKRLQIQQVIDSLDRPSQPMSGIYHYVKDVFDDHFIYEAMSDDQEPNKLYKQAYEIVDDVVSLRGEPEEVKQEMTYEKVTNQEKTEILLGNDDTDPKGGDKMEINELITQLIVNEATPWTEEDRPWLETASQETLMKMKPSESKEKPSKKPKEETPIANDGQANQEVPITVEEFIAKAPKEIGETLTEAMAMRANEKADLIKGILANQRNEFTEDELREMPQANLRKLGTLSRVSGSNYVGQGGAPVTNQEEPLDLPTLPTFN